MQFKLTQFIAAALFASLAMAIPASNQTITAADSDTSPIAPPSNEVVSALIVESDNEARIQASSSITVGIVWVDAYQGGKSARLNVNHIPSGCLRFKPEWKDVISSIQMGGAARCYFLRDDDCQYPFLLLEANEYRPNLQGTEFQDHIRSMACFEL